MAPTLRPLHPPHRKESNRPVRSACARVQTYREDSPDIDSDYGSSNSRRLTLQRSRRETSDTVPNGSPSTVARKAQQPKVTRSSSGSAKRSLFSQASRAGHYESPSKRRKHEDLPDSKATPLHTGVIPQWATLPYHILLEMFIQAAPRPNTDPTTDDTKLIKWLLAASRTCRAFFEPAMAALYYSPPLSSATKLVGLVQLLKRDPNGLMTNYRNKIKELRISAGLSQVRHPELFRLIALAPQLKYFRIYDPTEYGQQKREFPSSAFDSLVSILDENGCHLHFWEWNKRQIATNLKAVHLRPSFNTLRSLRLYNLDFEDEPADTSVGGLSENEQDSLAKGLPLALSVLPDLKKLELQNCSVASITFLLSLASDLVTLRLINCQELSSPKLERFLATHGHHLRELVLAHNRELNMTFTSHLRTSCPSLEVFRMDVNFSSPTFLYHDVKPHFDELLVSSATPSWPTSLRILQLERLQKWDIETTERVFGGLVDSGPRLVNLRTLIITVILNVNWRDRAILRKKWMKKLERTFLRKSAPPNPYYQTIRSEALPARPSSPKDPIESSSIVESSPRNLRTRHSARLAAEHGENHSRATQHSDYEIRDPSPDEPVQGMCNTVEIRMDNLRPADILLTAENFQDEELSGDEDWEGEDMDAW